MNEALSATGADNLESYSSNMDSGFMSSPSESNVPSFFSSFYNQTYDFGLSKQEEGIDETLINDPHFNGSVSSSANGGKLILTDKIINKI